MIDVLMKFDASVQAEQGKDLTKLVDLCISDKQSMLNYAMKFIMHAIRSCRDLQGKVEEGEDDQQSISMIQRMLNHLMKIRSLREQDDGADLFEQISQAQVYVCLADLARHDHLQVFNPTSLSLSMLSIEIFEALTYRINQIEAIKPIRDDEQCLIYLEALNKFKDIVDAKGSTDATIMAEKQVVLKLVTKFLNKELLKLNHVQKEDSVATNNEMIYILFLYLVSLDKRVDENGVVLPNPSVLFYAISLKEHADIKIRKEAARQIEQFDQQIDTFKLRGKESSNQKADRDGDVKMDAGMTEQLMV